MKNLKIGVKIIGAFCLITILVLIVGLVALYQQHQVSKNIDFIVNQVMPGQKYALELNNNIQTVSALINSLSSNSLTLNDRNVIRVSVLRNRTERKNITGSLQDLAIFKDIETEFNGYAKAVATGVDTSNQIMAYSEELVAAGLSDPYIYHNKFHTFRFETYAARLAIGNLVQRGIPIENVNDLSCCQLGQWLADVGTTNPELVSIANTIRPLHEEHHRTVEQIIELMAQGEEGKRAAYELMINKINPLLDTIQRELARGLAITTKVSEMFSAMMDLTTNKSRNELIEIDRHIQAMVAKIETIAAKAKENTSVSLAIGKTIIIICMVVATILSIGLGLLLTNAITKPLFKGVDLAKTMGSGDLTGSIDIDRQDEIGVLAKTLNGMAASLRWMFSGVDENVKSVDSASKRLAALSWQMSASAGTMTELSNQVAEAAARMSGFQKNIAATTEETSVGANIISIAVEGITGTANEIAASTARAREMTYGAVGQSRQVSAWVNDLGTAATEIDKVTEIITEISEQTNLLALNANIEAARAGQAGKGFAVIANEIKTLAKQTAGATLDIKNKIADMQRATVVTVQEINGIQQVIGDIDMIVATIATAAEEQSVTTKKIADNIAEASRSITEINKSVEQGSVSSEEIARDIADVSQSAKHLSEASGQVLGNADKLTKVAEDLKELVNRFKI